MKHQTIFYVNTETALKYYSNIKKQDKTKTARGHYFSSSCLLNFLETFYATQVNKVSLIYLAQFFHCYSAWVLRTGFDCKKRKCPYFPKFLQDILSKMKRTDTDHIRPKQQRCIQNFVRHLRCSILQ